MEAARPIQTTYASTRFRSRLEATWAAFFDRLKWRWEYEPIDLEGYIPDFVVTFPAGPLLVEVKPDFYRHELKRHVAKIQQTSWDKEVLIVGTHPSPPVDHRLWRLDWDAAALGLMRDLRFGHSHDDRGFAGKDGAWGPGVLNYCGACESWSLFHHDGMWNCRVHGCVDGTRYINAVPPTISSKLWRQAQNMVQWRPELPAVRHPNDDFPIGGT